LSSPGRHFVLKEIAMAPTLKDKINQLDAKRRKNVEAGAAELIAENMFLRDCAVPIVAEPRLVRHSKPARLNGHPRRLAGLLSASSHHAGS
jgi:hypothetical protein